MRFGKRTAKERRRLVELYTSRGGGETREDFCRIHGVAKSTLDYWRRIERQEPASQLVAVKLAPSSLPVETGGGFALSLAKGRRIESTWRFADADLARLIRIVESA